MRYKANRGGHAPGRLRDWFWRYLEAGRAIDGDLREEMVENITVHRFQLRGKTLEQWLLGQLWDCRDIMPSEGRQDVQEILRTDREYWTYAKRCGR
jgi:hypothetical protein